MDIWQDILSEKDQQVIDAAGYNTRGASTFASRRAGKSPALLLIDMQKLFVGEDIPILEAVQTAPTMIGSAGWRAIEVIQPLLTIFRQQKRPVYFAKMQPHNRPSDDPMLDIVEPLQPRDDETIITKHSTSVFFQSDLADDLRERGCDSVILCGNSTSGCVRAAAVDAVQHDFAVYVPYDAVFDRIEASHKIGLFDLWMKYATVLSSQEILAIVETLEPMERTYAD